MSDASPPTPTPSSSPPFSLQVWRPIRRQELREGCDCSNISHVKTFNPMPCLAKNDEDDDDDEDEAVIARFSSASLHGLPPLLP